MKSRFGVSTRTVFDHEVGLLQEADRSFDGRLRVASPVPLDHVRDQYKFLMHLDRSWE